jgi:hypothetical protein
MLKPLPGCDKLATETRWPQDLLAGDKLTKGHSLACVPISTARMPAGNCTFWESEPGPLQPEGWREPVFLTLLNLL